MICMYDDIPLYDGGYISFELQTEVLGSWHLCEVVRKGALHIWCGIEIEVKIL